MNTVIRTLFPRCRRPVRGDHPYVYTAVLLRDDVSVGELVQALKFTGIVVSTHAESGATVIHRPPAPKPAA
jgi:hypothetical protein